MSGFTTRCVGRLSIPTLTPFKPMYFVSDTHRADGGPVDDFVGAHYEAWRWFTEYVVGDAGSVVGLGDLRELWQTKNARPVCGIDCAVRGNHDAADRAPKRFWWPDGEHPVILGEHGHYADLWNSEYSWVGRWATWLAGGLERLGWSSVEEWAWKHLIPSAVGSSPSPYIRRAGRLVDKFPSLRLVVFGHTHVPMTWCTRMRGADGESNTYYLNVGCWVSPDYLGSYGRVWDGEVSLWLVEEE